MFNFKNVSEVPQRPVVKIAQLTLEYERCLGEQCSDATAPRWMLWPPILVATTRYQLRCHSSTPEDTSDIVYFWKQSGKDLICHVGHLLSQSSQGYWSLRAEGAVRQTCR